MDKHIMFRKFVIGITALGFFANSVLLGMMISLKYNYTYLLFTFIASICLYLGLHIVIAADSINSMKEKIYFSDLSIPMQIGIILSWTMFLLWTAIVFLGILGLFSK